MILRRTHEMTGGGDVNPGVVRQLDTGNAILNVKTQVADYAAMRIFARTDPAKLKGSAPTILDILEAPMGSAVPVTLTDWDLGFLRSLYASHGRQYANRQRKEMEGLLRKDLTQPER